MTTLTSRALFALILVVAAFGAAAQTADLLVTQTTGRNVLQFRTGNAFAIGVTNHGSATTNARVTYTAIGGVPASGAGTGWFCDAVAGSQLVCVTNNLAAGAVASPLTIYATPMSVGTQKYTSRVEVTSSVSDPNSANNVAESVHDVRYYTTTSIISTTPYPSGLGADVAVNVSVATHLGTRVSSGHVVIRDGTTVLGTVVLTDGRATLIKSDFALGAHYLTAEFIGSGNTLGSVSARRRHDVLQAASVTLSSSQNPSTYGSVRFSATVTSSNGTPSGYVSFYDGTSKITRLLLNNGSVSYNALWWAPRTHNVSAVYEGSSTHAAATSNTIAQVIDKATPTVTLTASAPSSTYGTEVTFTMKVTTGAGNGWVHFFRDGILVSEQYMHSGLSPYYTAKLPVGDWKMTAEFLGSSTHNAATSPVVTHGVSKMTTTTTLASSVNPSSHGQNVTLNATVAAGDDRPMTGRVLFYIDGAYVASRTLETAQWGATSVAYSTSALAVGAHSFEAVYAETQYLRSSSSTLTQTVNKTVTTTDLTSSANPSFGGEGVTFTASVAGTHGVIPQGTVTFKSGATALSTVRLVNGVAVYAASLPLGTYSITATYNGTATVQPSTSAAIGQAVQRRVDATITAVDSLCAGSTGITASVPAQSGVTYGWSVQGGTITAGTGTNRITFSSSGWSYVTVTASVSCDVCATATDSHTIATGSSVGVGSRDLSRDGKNDLVWQNRSTGATEVWAMNGTVPMSVIGIYSPGAGWSVEGVGDFNRDGNADLLYRNAETKEAMAWLMNGLSNIGSMSFSAPLDAAWTVGGIADFNCDNYPDVLWTNATTRENTVWLMDGNVVTNVVKLPSMGTGWRVEGLGDFNIDGRADVVWRRTDGRTALWTMNGLAPSSTLYPPPQLDLNWSLDAVADYNSDGRPDLVWRNPTTGANEIWLMNGITRTSIVQLTPVYDTNMVISGPK